MAGITGGGLVQLGYEPEVDFKLYDDGTGTVISEWNHADPIPSVAEIEAAEILYQQAIDNRIAIRNAARQYIAQRIGFTLSELEETDLLELMVRYADPLESLSPPIVPTTKEDFYRIAVADMNDALALTDNFITRESEYKKVLPAKITGNGSVNAFSFNLADLYKQAKGWREDILQTTVTRFKAIQAGADATAWQAEF